MTVELGRSHDETPLRRGNPDALAHEITRELARDTVDRVTLWHG